MEVLTIDYRKQPLPQKDVVADAVFDALKRKWDKEVISSSELLEIISNQWYTNEYRDYCVERYNKLNDCNLKPISSLYPNARKTASSTAKPLYPDCTEA